MEHFRLLLALHTTASEGVLKARYIVLLVHIQQIRVIYHYFERCPTHLNVVIDVFLQNYWFANLNEGSELRFVVFNVELAVRVPVDPGVES